MILPASVLTAVFALSAAPPADLKPAPALNPRPDEVVTGVPIAYYVLALSWTPEWCRSGGSGASAKEMECVRPLGFTLHGLWPDGAHPPYPSFCKPTGPLDISLVREMWRRTPSAVLLQHEWQKHGTCAAWPDARAFFAQSAKLYDRIAIPKIEAIAPGELTAGAVRAAFVARNPWLTADEIFVQSRRSDDALSEVRVCYDLKFQPAGCPGGNGAPDRARLTLAPSRTGAF
ncbi:ribonuclease T2 family protein [Phenylobacterium sp.]|uniref:ribonuclease T2 family protein n=1 Tax=Phenylobacterium sp. TaxID=1871053 RepID=UPI002CA074CD|nr:ribonuclease T [Phenylobacterium sp.]HLZ74229.1 ribonuclease T [Phenylobacterium sp.]